MKPKQTIHTGYTRPSLFDMLCNGRHRGTLRSFRAFVFEMIRDKEEIGIDPSPCFSGCEFVWPGVLSHASNWRSPEKTLSPLCWFLTRTQYSSHVWHKKKYIYGHFDPHFMQCWTTTPWLEAMGLGPNTLHLCLPKLINSISQISDILYRTASSSKCTFARGGWSDKLYR